MDHQRPVLPYPIVSFVLSTVALVHMYIIYSVAGFKSEILISLISFRSPFFTPCINDSVIFIYRLAYVKIKFFIYIVICTWLVVRDSFHIRNIKHIPAKKINGNATGFTFKLRVAVR